MSRYKQAKDMKKTQFQKLIKKKLQVYEVKIKLRGCLIDHNHKSRDFDQSMYQHKQISAMSKNITSTTSADQNRSYHANRNVSSSFQEPYKNPNPQKIELG
jgi:hypothetical protein